MECEVTAKRLRGRAASADAAMSTQNLNRRDQARLAVRATPQSGALEAADTIIPRYAPIPNIHAEKPHRPATRGTRRPTGCNARSAQRAPTHEPQGQRLRRQAPTHVVHRQRPSLSSERQRYRACRMEALMPVPQLVTGGSEASASTSLPDVRQHHVDRAFRTGLVARCVSIAANLATIPMALAALGNDAFGVWSAVTSTLALMTFLDFGIGNGVMGRITEALARDDDAAVRTLIRNAYALLAAIAIGAATLTAAGYWSGGLQTMADASGSFLAGHVGLTVAFLVAYALVIPASLVQRLLFAYQRAGYATLLQLCFSLFYLAVAAAAWHWSLGLATFVLGYVGSMIVVYGAGTLVFFARVAPSRAFSGRPNAQAMRELVRDAAPFFLLQVTAALVYNSDQLILTTVATPAEVAVYATIAKVFSIVTMVNSLLLGPLWPAYADARARDDWPWIRRAYYRSRRRSGLASLALAMTLTLVGTPLIAYWTGGRIHAPVWMLATMGAWVVLEGYGQCMAMLLNAARIVRLQLVITSALLIVGVGLKIYLSVPLGIYGPLVGTIVSFTLVVALYETRYVHQLLTSKNESMDRRHDHQPAD